MALTPARDMTVADQVANEIRRAIRDGRYQPGARLVERKLAAQFGTSHIPVREALARLSDEGLVERLPRRGARVAGLSLAELEEISSLRTVLEEFVVLRVQEGLSPEGEARLRGIVERMEQAATSGDVERVFELDREFHASLWELSDHDALVAVVKQLIGRLDAFMRAATLGRPLEEMPDHARAHRDLLEAILSRDAERARRTMAAHIQDATERLRALLAVEEPGEPVRA
jgi:DNA-binding GntR family transcriptional regulator